MIPFNLITGFLGSGKTTFLKEILDRYSENYNIAIIQNEFAPAGTDGIDLNLTGRPFQLLEINNGSVFCACKLGSFVQTIESLVTDYHPEIIFLEASGLADPVNILELLQDERLRDKLILRNIFTIVDAPNFEKGLNTLPRFKHQIMIADTIIINKIDIYEGSLSSLQSKIKSLNPFAEIVEASGCRFEMDTYILNDNTWHPAAAIFEGKTSEGRPSLNACVLRTHDRLSEDGLIKFLNTLKQTSPRIKGFVNTPDDKVLSIQSVYENVRMDEIAGYKGPTEIIAFGENLTAGYLRELMKESVQ